MQGEASLVTTLVQAGAGTGKTQSLSEEIILRAGLLHEKLGRVPRIVATTFTERATAELRERVLSILPKYLKGVETDWLQEFTREPGYLQISTIHGTLSVLLHRYGSLLGLDPGFKVLEPAEETDLINLVLRKVLGRDPETGEALLEDYTFGQLVELVQGLSAHYRYHGQNAKPLQNWREVLSAQEKQLRLAIQELLSLDAGVAGGKTAENIKILQNDLRKVLDASDTVSFQEAFNDALEGTRKPTIKEKGVELKNSIDQIFEIREQWKKEWASAALNASHEKVGFALEKLVRLFNDEYGREKFGLGVVTFEDLEFLSLELLERFPQVRASATVDWDYWFIDEYQDTSPLQKRILELFFQKPWNAYFVGDPQQSIYLFRGADKKVFENTLHQVGEVFGEIRTLDVNHRSEPSLLLFMNELFKNTRGQGFKELKPRAGGDRSCRAHFHKILSQPVDAPFDGEIIAGLEQIQKWVKAGYQLHQMAVLTRTNRRAQEFARAFSDRGVPVFMHEAGGFYSRREVIDALALLTFLDNPSRDDIFVLIARSPWGGIPDHVLAHWGVGRGVERSFWEMLTSKPEVMAEYPLLQRLRDLLKQSTTWPASLLLESAMESLGLFEYSAIGDGSGRREANLRKLVFTLSQEEIEPGFNLAAFLRRAWGSQKDGSGEAEAASFIEPKRVNILTIHKSKGLRFDCVIVPDCGEGYRQQLQTLELSPDGRWAVKVLSGESEMLKENIPVRTLKDERKSRELDEQQRVFYVAVTRSAQELSLLTSEPSHPESWLGRVSMDFSEGLHKLSRTSYEVHSWTGERLAEFLVSQNALPTWIDPDSSPSHVLAPFQYRSPLAIEKVDRSSVSELVEMKTMIYPEWRVSLDEQINLNQRGQALHFVFENWGRPGFRDLDEALELSIRHFGLKDSFDTSRFEETFRLKTPPLAKLLEQGRREFAFTAEIPIPEKGFFNLEGQIDLWGEADGGEIWVVDYKSYQSEPKTRQLEAAFWQMELYCLALEKMKKPWEKMNIAVVTPLLGKAFPGKPRPKDEILRDISDLFRSGFYHPRPGQV